MLKNSFQHIPGIGTIIEKQLWDSGILDWDSFSTGRQFKTSPKRRETITRYLQESKQHLALNNPMYFTNLLSANRHWRIFPEFRSSTAYLDIETTGLSFWNSDITTIALYDGQTIRYYVQGRNLENFMDDIEKYNVLVTYNGKTFDIPFIEEYFRIKMNHSHIDLRYALKSLGYSGGLKRCEKALGIDRGDLEGVDGYFAVLLWRDFQENKNEKALESLLAYNIEDVVNLETLMITVYNMKINDTPFSESHRLPLPQLPEVPFKPDPGTINRIKRNMFDQSDSYY